MVQYRKLPTLEVVHCPRTGHHIYAACPIHCQVPTLVLGSLQIPAPPGERCFTLYRHNQGTTHQLSAAAIRALQPLSQHMPRTVQLHVKLKLAVPAVVAAVCRLLPHVHRLGLRIPAADSPPPLWEQLLAGLPHLATLSFETCSNRLSAAHLASLAASLQAANRVVQVRVDKKDWNDTVSYPNMPLFAVEHLVW